MTIIEEMPSHSDPNKITSRTSKMAPDFTLMAESENTIKLVPTFGFCDLQMPELDKGMLLVF